MNERAKITASHHSRQAIVYLRQSSPAQVEHNRESTERQYALANKARELALVAGQPQIAQKAEERLALYREGKPYHSPPPNP